MAYDDPTTEQRLERLERVLFQLGRLCAGLGDTGAEPTAARAGLPVVGAGEATEFSLREFLESVDDLTSGERAQLVDAALVMIEGVYVHLPLKRAMHAVDPIQRLKILSGRVETISSAAFHDEMRAVFRSLRDLHTIYVLPASYRGKTAFLPFLVEEYFEESGGDLPSYVVTQVRPGELPPDFQPGVTLNRWNGIPIHRAVEINAEREAGSNDDARHARGLEALTLRPMEVTAPPDEEWVTVGYLADGQEREARVAWRVIQPPPSPAAGHLMASESDIGALLGVDLRTETARRVKKALFFPDAMAAEQEASIRHASKAVLQPERGAARSAGPQPGRKVEAGTPGPGQDSGPEDFSLTMGLDIRTEEARRARKALFFPEAMEAERVSAGLAEGGLVVGAPSESSRMPDVLTGKTVAGPHGELGYIRIYTFMVDADEFVAEFVRIARGLPQTGLIIDVRGNGGGNILAGERLLQVLTPQLIDPARFHFINTPTTMEICRRAPAQFNVRPWAAAISLAIQTGETYSQGFTLEPPERYNRLGQQYQGPVALIIDALCYSTTDIFSASFQDHEIGPILGAQRHTGAGGANVWRYDHLGQALPDKFPPLPKGATFRVAVRRSTRVKARAGVPLEDLGVEADDFHRMTRADVLDGNRDLIAKAAQLLVGRKVWALSGRVDRSRPPAVRVEVSARNLTRVDVFQDGRPLASGDITNGTISLLLPAELLRPATLQLRGFDEGKFVAVASLDLT